MLLDAHRKQTGKPWAYESLWKLRTQCHGFDTPKFWQPYELVTVFLLLGYQLQVHLNPHAMQTLCDLTWSRNNEVTVGFGKVVLLLFQGLSANGLVCAKSAYWTLSVVWLLIKSRHFPEKLSVFVSTEPHPGCPPGRYAKSIQSVQRTNSK